MNIEFYSSHMDTLFELKQMAEKNNCKISLGFDTSSYEDIDEDILKECGFNEEFLSNLDSCYIKEQMSGWSKVWFELYDKNNNTYNTLVYMNNYCRFNLEILNYDDCDEDFINFIQNHYDVGECGTDEYFCNFNNSPTIIHGFNNQEEITDHRVYRAGMALSYFSDLVCDYLREERIVRTY